MATKAPLDLSRRERQIMSVLYRLGRATAAEVLAELPDPPSYSAVRAHLRVLEDKGHAKHEDDGTRYVFRPTVPRDRARRGALHDMVQTFFDGSASQAVAALLDADPSISKAELDRLMKLIEQARAEGR
jgi:predicted transcriptional regulator